MIPPGKCETCGRVTNKTVNGKQMCGYCTGALLSGLIERIGEKPLNRTPIPPIDQPDLFTDEDGDRWDRMFDALDKARDQDRAQQSSGAIIED
jgi:hypothetical protein